MNGKYKFLSKVSILTLPLLLSGCSFSFGGFSNFGNILPGSSASSSSSSESSISHIGSSEQSSSTEEEVEYQDLDKHIRELNKTKIRVGILNDHDSQYNEIHFIYDTVNKFNSTIDNPQQKFDVEFETISDYSHVISRAGSNNSFDLCLMRSGDLSNMYSLLKKPFNRYATYIREKNYDFAIKELTFGNEIYGFPAYLSNGFFMWRDSRYLYGNESLEEILLLARECGKKVMLELDNGWYLSSYLFSPQGCGQDSFRLVKEYGDQYKVEVKWDETKCVNHLSYLRELFTSYSDCIQRFDDVAYGFSSGNLLCAFGGTWMKDWFLSAGLDYIIPTVLPYYDYYGTPCQLANFCGVDSYVVTSSLGDPQREETAMALAYLLTTPETQKNALKYRNNLPSTIVEVCEDANYVNGLDSASSILLSQTSIAGINQNYTVGTCYDYWNVTQEIGLMLWGKLHEDRDLGLLLNQYCEALRSQRYSNYL